MLRYRDRATSLNWTMTACLSWAKSATEQDRIYQFFYERDLINDDSSFCSQILLTVDLQCHVFPFEKLLLNVRLCLWTAFLWRQIWRHHGDVTYDVITQRCCMQHCWGKFFNVLVHWSIRMVRAKNKIHVQTNTKSVQCINTKHNKVRITQSQWTSRKHAYWRSLQGLSGKWKWGRQMARPWKPPASCKITKLCLNLSKLCLEIMCLLFFRTRRSCVDIHRLYLWKGVKWTRQWKRGRWKNAVFSVFGRCMFGTSRYKDSCYIIFP